MKTKKKSMDMDAMEEEYEAPTAPDEPEVTAPGQKKKRKGGVNANDAASALSGKGY